MRIRKLGAIAVLGLAGLTGPASADHIAGAAHWQDNATDFAWHINAKGHLIIEIGNMSSGSAAVTSLRFTRNHGDGMGEHDYGQGCRSGCGASDVPEPGMLILFGTGLLGIGFVVWRRRKKKTMP